MTDYFLPPDLPIVASTNSFDANTASFSSPTVGSTRTVERLGDRLRFQVSFATMRDDPATHRNRGRLQSLLSKLRGQANRIYMTPPGDKLRGSFPCPEMLTNNFFKNGLPPFISDSQYGLYSTDNGVRVLRRAVQIGSAALTQQVTRSLNTPYCLRGFVTAGKGNMPVQIADFVDGWVSPSASSGLLKVTYNVNTAGSGGVGFYDSAFTNELAGNYFDVEYMSLARCALVDNAPNLLLNSDTPGGTSWSLTMTSAGLNGTQAPDGSSTAWALNDTATTGAHIMAQNVTVPTGPAYYVASIYVQAQNRGWVYFSISDNVATIALAYYNISTGAPAVGTVSLSGGSGFANLNATIQDVGAGWYRINLSMQKGTGSTVLSYQVGMATGNSAPGYAGNNAVVGICTWRASLTQSGFPVSMSKTTTAAVAAVAQTGTGLNIKGLPVSTSGLLLPGDWIQCNGQLNQVASQLDSDGSGLGFLQCVRPLRNSPVDNEPVIVRHPLGKFMVNAASTAWNEQPGGFSDASIEFSEDISF